MFKHSSHFTLTIHRLSVLMKNFKLDGMDGTKKRHIKGRKNVSHHASQKSFQFVCEIYLPLEHNKVEQQYLDVFIYGTPVLGYVSFDDAVSEEVEVYFQFEGIIHNLELLSDSGNFASFRLEIKINQIEHF